MPAKEHPPVFDHSFSVFSLGLTLGIVGAMLLGTKQGRQISREIIDTLSRTKPKGDLHNKSDRATVSTPDKLEEDINPQSPPPASFRELPQKPLSEPQYFRS